MPDLEILTKPRALYETTNITANSNKSLFNNPKYSDIIIVATGKDGQLYSYYGHKAIISQLSSYFDILFESCPDDKQITVPLYADHLKWGLKYIYGYDIKLYELCPEDVIKIIEMSFYLGMELLIKYIKRYYNFLSISNETLMTYLNLAKQYRDSSFYNSVVEELFVYNNIIECRRRTDPKLKLERLDETELYSCFNKITHLYRWETGLTYLLNNDKQRCLDNLMKQNLDRDNTKIIIELYDQDLISLELMYHPSVIKELMQTNNVVRSDRIKQFIDKLFNSIVISSRC